MHRQVPYVLKMVFFPLDVSIGFNQTSFEFEESARLAILTLVVSGILGRAITLEVLTSDGTATGKSACRKLKLYQSTHPYSFHCFYAPLSVAGEDYTALSVDITISAGETVYQVEVPLIDDEAVEGEENFSVFLSTTDTALLISTETATVAVKDDDRKAVCYPQCTPTAAAYVVCIHGV